MYSWKIIRHWFWPSTQLSRLHRHICEHDVLPFLLHFSKKYLVENIQEKFQKDPSTSQLLFLSNQLNFQLWKNLEESIIRDSACQFNIGKTLERQLCKLISWLAVFSRKSRSLLLLLSKTLCKKSSYNFLCFALVSVNKYGILKNDGFLKNIVLSQSLLKGPYMFLSPLCMVYKSQYLDCLLAVHHLRVSWRVKQTIFEVQWQELQNWSLKKHSFETHPSTVRKVKKAEKRNVFIAAILRCLEPVSSTLYTMQLIETLKWLWTHSVGFFLTLQKAASYNAYHNIIWIIKNGNQITKLIF